MSDSINSISNASNTISSQLTTSQSGPSFLGQPDCTSSNLRFLLFVCTMILFVCFCMSLVSQLCYESAGNNTVNKSKRTCGCARCRRAVQEHFSNDDLYAYSSASSAGYQSIPLTAPSTEPSNLLFGQANRYISTNNDITIFTLDINANLYILNGNVFQQGTPPNHSYKAYLGDDNKQIELGDLKKDGDGIYKLKFTSQNIKELVDLRSLSIVYDKETQKQTLLVGKFS